MSNSEAKYLVRQGGGDLGRGLGEGGRGGKGGGERGWWRGLG